MKPSSTTALATSFESTAPIVGLSAERAHKLLLDLLQLPVNSKRPRVNLQENEDWLASLNIVKDPTVYTPYPYYTDEQIKQRIHALVASGADVEKGRCLVRAVHRKHLGEVEALLSLPTPPKPSQRTTLQATALHRAAYAGPDILFKRLASIADPADWGIKDKDHKIPLEKAFMSARINRAQLAATFSTPDNEQDINGNSFYHRFALFITAIDEDKRTPWVQVFDTLIERAKPDMFLKNNAGQTVATLWWAGNAFYEHKALTIDSTISMKTPKERSTL